MKLYIFLVFSKLNNKLLPEIYKRIFFKKNLI